MKTCPICKVEFKPRKPLQKVCSLPCALEDSKIKRSKSEKAAARKARKEWHESNMTIAMRARETQKVFNRYIRVRDQGQPCISCGIMHGQMHAGHYRTTRAAPILRYRTDAVFLQCAQCNAHKSGNQVEYRKALVARYGPVKVEILDLTNDQPHFTHEYLKRLARIYRKKTKLYERLFR